MSVESILPERWFVLEVLLLRYFFLASKNSWCISYRSDKKEINLKLGDQSEGCDGWGGWCMYRLRKYLESLGK